MPEVSTERPRLYLETSVVSYLTARIHQNQVVAAHQKVTREWWTTRAEFELYVSDFVLAEAARGDTKAAARRLAALEEIPILRSTADTEKLAAALLAGEALPEAARLDALHVAVAAAHGMDYLLTWNCKHIANAMRRATITQVCRGLDIEPPVICTPLELP